MVETIVTWLWLGIEVYTGAGLLFGFVFTNRSASRVDPSAKEGSSGFRVMIFPASVLLWPFLAAKLRQGAELGNPANPEAPLSPCYQRLWHGLLIATLALTTGFLGIKALSSRSAPPATTVAIP